MNRNIRIGIVSMFILASLWFVTGNAYAATSHSHVAPSHHNHVAKGTQSSCGAFGGTGNHDNMVSVYFKVWTYYPPCVMSGIGAYTFQPVTNMTVTVWGYDGVYHTIEWKTVYRIPGINCCVVSLPVLTAQCGMIYHVEAIARYWILWGTILASDTVNTNAIGIC